MFARINTFDGSTERFDEAGAFLRDFVVPASRQIPGFAGMISLIDRETGRSMGITLWQSREALDASEEGAALMREQVASTGAAILLSVERFEVADLTLV